MTDPVRFGAPGCTCRPFTADPPRFLDQPGDTIDRNTSWQRGQDCVHHAVEAARDEEAGSGWTQLEARAFNAVGPAVRDAGQWLPLSARRAVAKAVLAELKPELAALDRVHRLADLIAAGAPWAANRDDLARRIRDAAGIDSGQAATGATEAEKTTRVFAALHRSAEEDVSRVIDLYEQWVKAGPPPLGVLINRWWDARLVELHNAILPPQERP